MHSQTYKGLMRTHALEQEDYIELLGSKMHSSTMHDQELCIIPRAWNLASACTQNNGWTPRYIDQECCKPFPFMWQRICNIWTIGLHVRPKINSVDQLWGYTFPHT
jgi:hypothetical protein